jgi:hypothetical protein
MDMLNCNTSHNSTETTHGAKTGKAIYNFNGSFSNLEQIKQQNKWFAFKIPVQMADVSMALPSSVSNPVVLLTSRQFLVVRLP